MVYVDLDPVALADPHVPAHNEEREHINALQADIITKVKTPTSPTLGSLMKWDGDKYVPTSMRLFEGNGQPEGVVAAPVGSHYIDLLATNGTPEWYKATGIGNTGWIPLLSSLPWTNVSPGSGWAHTAGNPGQVSMLNGVIYFRGSMIHNSGTNFVMGTITSQYRPLGTLLGHVRTGGSATVASGVTISSTGSITISSDVDNHTVYLESFTCAPYRK